MMLGLIGMGLVGAATVFSHVKSRQFVRKRMKFTSFVEKPGLGVAAGVVTAVALAPVVWVLPVVGAGTAMLIGAGVGSGVAIGAKEATGGGLDD